MSEVERSRDESPGAPEQEGPVTTGSASGIWRRGFYMLLFVLIYGVAEVVLGAVGLIQFGWVALSGDRNERLRHFGADLSRFLFEVMLFWTFASEPQPFPFADWPSGSALEAAGPEAAGSGDRR
ncbi:MAG: DUF4389 domain-containing protein [bacterium]